MYIKILCLRTLAKPIRMNEFNKQWMCKENWPFSCDRNGGRGRKEIVLHSQLLLKIADLCAKMYG